MRERSVFKMADDFDKEAPDVMMNQIITENPLEFSVIVIKKEVLNFYDSEFESTTSSVQDRKPYLQEDIIPNTFEALSSEIPDNEIYRDKLLNSNKIILGSKPNLVSDDEYHCENSDKLYPENDVSFANDSKLHPDSIDENYFEELVTSYEPKVELLDIQSYLHKSRRYCATCGILFPELKAFEKHVRIYHKASDLNKRRIYKCTICDKKFVARQVLKKHISNIHKLNNVKILQRSRYRRVLDQTMRQHRCTICAKKFVAPHVLRTHLTNIHKINYAGVPHEKKQNTIHNTTKELDSQNVNHDKTLGSSNTCFHCKKTFDTQKCLIEHLYDVLQMKRKNTEIVPVLKSILFKCNKCDINFTSSQFAANHAEHMEMLINWKCTICNRIFKQEDALSHERQHSVSNNFLVYNLEDLDVTRILYKCSKCAVHFTESNFLYHFRDCGLEVSESVHCKICNMSLDYNIITSHESENHTEPNYYTIIESDVISDSPVKLTANKYQAKDNLQELSKPFRNVKVVLQRINSNKVNKSNSVKWSSDESLSDLESSSYEQTSNSPQKLQKDNNTYGLCSTTETTARNQKKIDLRREHNLTYYYCQTCKCFVSRLKKKVHLEARCKKITKKTCKQCGLTFTAASLMTHISLHKERKDLTLRSFKFFNLHNGQPINPAMPEFENTKQLQKDNNTYGLCSTTLKMNAYYDL
ncbi:zinc finger protein Xfin-like [Cydia amplana]|uniref:zinc finger protein Xfin-like n=1 Tax=Cydia amplana TaxID=1869771 RepID=UPI002FE63196